MVININKNELLKLLAANVVFAVFYILTGKLGLSLASINPTASAVWPPTGIALAGILFFGPKIWPGLFAGAFIVNFLSMGSYLAPLAIASGNTLEGLVGAYLVTRFAGGVNAFARTKTILIFLIFGAALAPMISATIGVATLYLVHSVNLHNYFQVWLTWWMGDMTGAMIFTPFILLWLKNPNVNYPAKKLLEWLGFTIAFIAICLAIFGSFPFGLNNYPTSFLIIPFYVWLALNFSPRETATATIILSAFALWGTLHGYGPYANIDSNPNTGLLVLVSFIGVTSMASLVLAAVVSDNKKKGEALILANRSKDEFLAVLGHELRNPLATIVTNMELISMHSPKESEIELASSRIDTGLKHMTRLLNELLDIARINSNKIILHKEVVDIRDIVKRSVENINKIVSHKGHMLTISMPNDPVIVTADPLRVEQIITNLLHNAAKYTEPGGKIVLSISKKREHVAIKITDNGIGIPADKISSIFDMYSQVHGQSRLRSEAGLGVGLKLSKTLAELHGGYIKAVSGGEGLGSEFTLRLPLE